MKKKVKAAALCLCAAMGLCGCGMEADAPEQTPISSAEEVPANADAEEAYGIMTVEALDVGKADSILIRTQNHNVLIDTATSGKGKEIREYLTELGIDRLDYLIITHFDKDHVGGVPKILKSISADNLLQPDYEGNNGEYEKYIEATDENSLERVALTDKMSFVLDDVNFTVYPPEKASYVEEDNDFSLVVMAEHGNNRFLFTGDAEEERVNEIISYNLGTFDYIKVPHHGVYEDNLPALFNSVQARYAVICDSEDEAADKLTLSALNKAGAQVYETKDGAVTAISDGNKITVTLEENITNR